MIVSSDNHYISCHRYHHLYTASNVEASGMGLKFCIVRISVCYEVNNMVMCGRSVFTGLVKSSIHN